MPTMEIALSLGKMCIFSRNWDLSRGRHWGQFNLLRL
jgi:hypothetical protein